MALLAGTSLVVACAGSTRGRPANELPIRDPVLGSPLVIRGRVVPFDEVRTQVCLGELGQAEIELAKLRIFLAEEIRRRLRVAGVAEPEIPEYSEPFLRLEEEARLAPPELDADVNDSLPWVGGDPEERLTVIRFFHKIFLPANPDEWPPVTLEAVMKQEENGQQLIDYYRDSWQRRENDTTPRPRNKAERSFDSTILAQVADQLNATARVEKSPAPGVLYRVNGVDIRQEDIWKRIEPRLSAFDVRCAKQWMANLTVLRQALEKAGAWLTGEEAEAAYRAESDPFRDSIFSLELFVVAIKRFPSVEAYKEYRRVYESFERWIAPKMTEDALQKQADFRTRQLVGHARVDVDVLLCSAYDFERRRWKENGWAEAERRMQEVQQLLSEGSRTWDELMDSYTDFRQPELEPNPPRKGRFCEVQHDQLRSFLGESEYWQFLTGDSITDSIFFEQEVGALSAPRKGPWGWYLTRLGRRSGEPRVLVVAPQEFDGLVRQDYLRWSLYRYTQQLLEENAVQGLDG